MFFMHIQHTHSAIVPPQSDNNMFKTTKTFPKQPCEKNLTQCVLYNSLKGKLFLYGCFWDAF